MPVTPFPFMPTRRDLTIIQGATWTYPIIWQRPAGNPLDLSGFRARMHIRKSYRVPDLLAELTTENGRIVIDGAEGRITLSLSAEETGALRFSEALYDLELVQDDPVWVVRLIAGKVRLERSVTR